jgi:hypothetical protein
MARWPFMSRRTHEEVITELKAAMADRLASTEKWLADERVRSWALNTQMVEMKREGFQIVHPTPARNPVNPTPSDDAINERAGRNPMLRRHLISWRNQQRAAGMPEVDLSDAITNWRDPDSNGEGE